MYSMPNDLIAGEPDRWRRLVDLFGDPTNDAEAQFFAFVVRYTLPGSLSILEDLVHRQTLAALRDGSRTGRDECLRAIADLILEVGTDDEDQVAHLRALVGAREQR